MSTPAEIQSIFAGLEAKAAMLKGEIAAEVVTRAKQKTPVKTGNLAASWAYAVADGDITITNNAKDAEGNPYAIFVEYGTSKMAPRGMLASTVLELPQIVDVAMTKVGLK